MIGIKQPTLRLTLTTTPSHTMSVTLAMTQSSLSGGQEPPQLVIADTLTACHGPDREFSGTNLALLMTNTSAEESTESKERRWK